MFASKAYPEFFPEGETLRVKIHGEIDHHSAQPLREEIDLASARYRPGVLALEMENVTFMDSSGLGLVLGRVSKGEEKGYRVEVRNPGEQVLRILKMAGIQRMKQVTLILKKKETEPKVKTDRREKNQ